MRLVALLLYGHLPKHQAVRVEEAASGDRGNFPDNVVRQMSVYKVGMIRLNLLQMEQMARRLDGRVIVVLVRLREQFTDLRWAAGAEGRRFKRHLSSTGSVNASRDQFQRAFMESAPSAIRKSIGVWSQGGAS